MINKLIVSTMVICVLALPSEAAAVDVATLISSGASKTVEFAGSYGWDGAKAIGILATTAALTTFCPVSTELKPSNLIVKQVQMLGLSWLGLYCLKHSFDVGRSATQDSMRVFIGCAPSLVFPFIMRDFGGNGNSLKAMSAILMSGGVLCSGFFV